MLWVACGHCSIAGYARSRERSAAIVGDVRSRGHVGMGAPNFMASVAPDVVFAFSSAMGQYIVDANLGSSRVIMDFVDVDSDKWRQYAESAVPPMRWIYAREARRLLAFDRRMAAKADGAVFVSEAEAALFRSLAPEVAAKTHAVANGIDSAYFSPDHDFPSLFTGSGPHLVFTGTMDYRPNVDAVTWFVADIFPLILRRSAKCHLHHCRREADIGRPEFGEDAVGLRQQVVSRTSAHSSTTPTWS